MTRRTIVSKRGPFEGKIRGYYPSNDVDKKLQNETKQVNNVSNRVLREEVYRRTGSKEFPNSLSREQLIAYLGR